MTSKRPRCGLHGVGASREYADALGHATEYDALGYMLGTLGHEMRSPINAIALDLELLRRAPAGPEQGRTIAAIARQLEVLARLAEDLFLAAQLPSGEDHFVRAPVDLNAIVQVALETCRAGIDERRHRLIVRYHADPLIIDGDAARLQQVIVNLVDNAVKYTPQYGRIVVRTAQEGDRAVLYIRDNGIGIARDKLKRVFEPFHQIGDPRAQSRGIGLGLPLVKKWVDLHGGAVKVHSDGADLGSEFMVWFPLPQQSAVRRLDALRSKASME